MPITLTDIDSFDNATGPIGSDIRNAANVRAFFQALANRGRYLYNRINPLASVAALKAIDTTSLATGTSRVVIGQGLFTLDAVSAVAPLEPYIVQPTVGPGRWFAAHAHRTTRVIRLFPGHLFTTGLFDIPVAGGGGTDTANFAIGQNYTSFDNTELDDYFQPAYGALACRTLSGTSNRNVAWVKLPLPDGVTITSIAAYMRPAVVGSLPVNMPWISAIRIEGTNDPLSTPASYLLSTEKVFDTSANPAAYNATHAITLVPNQNNVVDRALYTYELVLGFASGAGAVVGDHFKYIDVTLSVPDARGA